MTDEELKQICGVETHPFYTRTLSDGRVGMVYDISFGRARLSFGPAGALGFDETY